MNDLSIPIETRLSSQLSQHYGSHEIPKIFADIKITCPQGNTGYAYCLECDKCSTICNQEAECLCYSLHQNCENIKRISMFNANIQNQMKHTKILENVTKLSQEMIDNISQLQQKIRQKYLIFGLNQADTQMVDKIRKYAKQKSPLKSEDFQRYKEKYPKQQKQWFSKEMGKFSDLLQKTKLFIDRHLVFIKKLIYYDHMENAKNPNQIVFTNSSILSGDQKRKTMMLEMLRDLGKFGKAQKLYSINQDAFTLKRFYEKCTDKKQLLYLIKNCDDRIYGAYSPIKMMGSGGTYNDQSKKTFIFDLQQNQKSQLIKAQNMLTFLPAENDGQTNKQKLFMFLGDKSSPNLVISEDSKSNQRLNYLWFGKEIKNDLYFQEKPSKWYHSTKKRTYTLKEFQVFELTFK